MTADTLRQAAQLMRERAQNATPSADPNPGGWAGYSRATNDDSGDAAIYGGPTVEGYRTSAVFTFETWTDCENCGRPTNADVQHMASWHPSVASAVADLLDVIAQDVGASTWAFHAAFDVARAYLGAAQ